MTETRFLKHPISALNAYIGSDKFKEKRKNREVINLEEGIVQNFLGEDLKAFDEPNSKVQITCSGKIVNKRIP